MNTEHDWLVWWHDEGSGMRPVNGQDHDIVDIVTLLRSPDRFEPYTCNAAADEIERLRKEAFSLAANQCHAGYGGEYGHHRCREIDRLFAEHDALRAERDEVRKSYCSLMEAYRGGDGRVTANKLGWGYLFEEDKPCQ